MDFLGILWVLVFSSLVLMALLFHGKYNILTEPISKLGNGGGEEFFNSGLIISGYLGSIMAYERYRDFSKLLTIVGIFTMQSLAFVGWFPINYNLHGFFTFLLFASMGLFFLLYAIKLKSFLTVAVLVAPIICVFINIPLAEWIVFITANVWVGITSTKFYYQKRSLNINL